MAAKKRPECFIIMPITTRKEWVGDYGGDKDHFRHVLDHLLVPAVDQAGFEPIRPAVEGSEIIQAEIIRSLETSELVLCDMSRLNANVFFELGIRTSQNKPAILVRDDLLDEEVPFDTKMVKHHVYDRELLPWKLDKQIATLVKHIKASVTDGQNAMWKYFGLSASVHPVGGMQGEEGDGVAYLARQFEALRSEMRELSREETGLPRGYAISTTSSAEREDLFSDPFINHTDKIKLPQPYVKFDSEDLIIDVKIPVHLRSTEAQIYLAVFYRGKVFYKTVVPNSMPEDDLGEVLRETSYTFRISLGDLPQPERAALARYTADAWLVFRPN